MSLSELSRDFQTHLEHVRRIPIDAEDREQAVQDLQKARDALWVAWLENKLR